MKISLHAVVILSLTFANYGFSEPNQPQPVPDIAKAKQFAKSELKIEEIRASKTPDWAAVSAQYKLMLPVVKYIDEKCKLDYDKQMQDALKNCAAGSDVETNDETIGKGLQHINVLAIRQELDMMSADPNNIKPSAQRVAAYFEGIRPTFVRRDKGFFEGKKTLEAAADEALKELSKASKTSLLTASRNLDDVIAKTYALSVLYEVQEIEKKRSSDVAFCNGKRVEAKIFYRVLQQRIEKRSPKINETIVNILNGGFGGMNSMLLEKELVAGLRLKLR
jgi:hypothetical protein